MVDNVSVRSFAEAEESGQKYPFASDKKGRSLWEAPLVSSKAVQARR